MADYKDIAGRIRTTASDGVSVEAQEILDISKNKKQSQINAETDTTLANHASAIQGLNSQNYETYAATDQTTAETDVLPADGSEDTIYRLGNWDGTQYDETCYSEYSWNGSAYVHISTKTQIGEVFDISAYHATGGTLADYADLAAALGTNGANVPPTLRKGGMSVKYVQTYDNKYVQYFLTKYEWSASEDDWEKMNLEEEVSRLGQGVGTNLAIPNKALTDSRLMVDNDDCYITPLFPADSFVWNLGAADTRIRVFVYDSNLDFKTSYIADSTSVSKSNYSGSGWAYMRATFHYNGGGSLVIAGKTVWTNDNGIKDRLFVSCGYAIDLIKTDINILSSRIGSIENRPIKNKKLQANDTLVDAEGYYVTPYLYWGGGSVDCVVGTADANIAVIAYNNSFEKVNAWTMGADFSRTGISAVWIRACFKHNGGGSITLNGRTAWVNTNNIEDSFVITNKDLDHVQNQVDSINDNVNSDIEDKTFLITDNDGNIGVAYDKENGFDVAKVSQHFKNIARGNLSYIQNGNKFTFQDLGSEFRIACRFVINKDVNISSSTDNIAVIGDDNVALLSSPVTLLDSYLSGKLGTVINTPQQQPCFNSGFSILGNNNIRQQNYFKPLVGTPALYIWLKGDFSEMAEAASAETLQARSATLSTMQDYNVRISSDTFGIYNGDTAVYVTSLKNGNVYKTLTVFYEELKSNIDSDFAIKLGDMSERLTCESLLQFGRINLVGHYYQELTKNSVSFDYYYDSYPVPLYLKQDNTVHSLEIVKSNGYLYAGVDGICYKKSVGNIPRIVIGHNSITIKSIIAENSIDNILLKTDWKGDAHIISDYSPAILGVQCHYIEDCTESEKITYKGTAATSYSIGDSVYLSVPTVGNFKVVTAAVVSENDEIYINIRTLAVTNHTTGVSLGTAVSGTGNPSISTAPLYGLYYQVSQTRALDYINLIKDNGYTIYGCKDLINIISGNLIPSKRSIFILKTDSTNGGGLWSCLKDNINRETFDKYGIDYIIGSIIENDLLDHSKYPTENDYRVLATSAAINGKDVITHSLTHDCQLENKNSVLVHWELQENIRYALSLGLVSNMYSWPGGPCTSENIYSMMACFGYIGSIGNEIGFNVQATQPFRLHRNDIADRQPWDKVEGFYIKL